MDVNERAVGELRDLEDEFWQTWGQPMLDGGISGTEFRRRLMKFAVGAYRVGLLAAAALIERRTSSSE